MASDKPSFRTNQAVNYRQLTGLLWLILYMVPAQAATTANIGDTLHAHYVIAENSTHASRWRQCLQRLPDPYSNLRWDSAQAPWLLHLHSYTDQESHRSYAAVVILRQFDNKSTLNNWMRGFPQPLPYSAMSLLQQYTAGLSRLHSHWIEPVEPQLAGFCHTIIDSFLARVAGNTASGNQKFFAK